MIEAIQKMKTLPGPNKEAGSMEKTFKLRFPRVFEIEKKQISSLREYTSGVVGEKKISEVYGLVNHLAIKGGFNEVIINPQAEAILGTNVPFNIFLLPARYIKNLNDLLSPAFPDDDLRKTLMTGVEKIIERQAEFKKGKTLETIIKITEKNEKMIKLDEKMKTRIAMEKSPDREIIELMKTMKEKNILTENLSIIVRSQFIEKIKKDPNFIKDIAAAETLSELLEFGVINGAQLEKNTLEQYILELYPDSILNSDTRNAIIKEGNEIRKKIKDTH